MTIYLDQKTWIRTWSRAQVRALLFYKAPMAVLVEYSDSSNVFSMKNVAELLEYTKMNNYSIKLEESQQPLSGLINSLELVELETLTMYIKTNLTNGFI